MLSATLHAGDLGGLWAQTPGGWSAGRSTIQPYPHPALHAGMLVSARRTAILVRERVGGSPAPGEAFSMTTCSEREIDRALTEVRSWPLDFLEILISRHEGGAEVRLRCGAWGTAPVYLVAHGGVLHVDWNVPRLYPHLRSAALDPGFAAQYLFGLEHPYSRRTIFPDLARLTERATATWRSPHQAVTIAYPRPEPHALAGRLKRGARVEETFVEILSASMRRWLGSGGGSVSVELSGGLDSSIVAATASTVADAPVRSLGMIMPGEPGQHQRGRRAEIVERFRLLDRTLPCLDNPPFSPRSSRVQGRAAVPWSEFYEEAVGAMLDLAGSSAPRLLFTGMGGDELCSFARDEVPEEADADDSPAFDGDVPEGLAHPTFATDALREAFAESHALVDAAPQALMYTSTLESAAAVSTLYLSHGVWPVSPLCTPELVEFCRRLPVSFRLDRTIHRKVLTSFGCSPLITHPRPEHLETFSDVMDFALHEGSAGVIEEVFRTSRLADQGLVDRDALIVAHARLRRGDERHADRILGALVLELTVRSVEHHRAQPG